MALLHRDHDHETTEVPDHPPAEWTTTSQPVRTAPEPEPVVVRRNSAGQTIRAVVATVCIVAIGAFMAMNTDDTSIDLGFDTYMSPLWATTGIAAAVGVVLGFALGHRRRDHA
jgi:uncharacterized integral membrane protein